MIFLVVGCDATGKTTLCNKLKEKYNLTIIHKDKPKNEEEQEYMFKEYKSLFLSSNNFIMDRSFYCEMVYGPIFRNKSSIDVVQQRALEDILDFKGAAIIYCWDYAKNIFERFKETKESFVITLEQINKIQLGYQQILETVDTIPVIYLNNFERSDSLVV